MGISHLQVSVQPAYKRTACRSQFLIELAYVKAEMVGAIQAPSRGNLRVNILFRTQLGLDFRKFLREPEEKF
jgi:hypothetical protein